MRALLTVSDKTGLVSLSRALVTRGYELVSTGRTARALADEGVRAASVSDLTGFPELMGGRVKTLHPAVHGGILARRDRPQDLHEARVHGIALIDLVVVNLYPFVRAAADPATSVPALVEEIDIGGPTLVRAAAKNFRDVLVVVDPADYPAVLRELDRAGGPTPDFRLALARKAFAHTAAYDAAIAATLRDVIAADEGFERMPRPSSHAMPDRFTLSLQKRGDLRYGENPHQRGGWYATDEPGGLGGAVVLQGKELSFTNLLDLDAAARIVSDFDEPAATVVKHTSPCGAATGATIYEAYVRARDADALAAFGGIVGLNRAIDDLTARAIVSTFVEAVVAPGVEAAAQVILAAKPTMRAVALAPAALPGERLEDALEVRSILGALLVQQRDAIVEARSAWPPAPGTGDLRVVTKRQPSAEEWVALRFAWRICGHVKSNAVVFTNTHTTLAIGAGQMSRVDAVVVAVMKATRSAGARTSPLAGSVAASDAFFPFRDGIEAIAAAGATAVVQPGGSTRDDDVIAAADDCGLAMVFTGRRHFRH